MVTCVPGGKPILVGDCIAALADTVNSVSGVMRWSRSALSVKYSVISLVVDAGCHGMVALLARRTFPELASTRIVESARAGVADTTAVKATAPTAMELRTMPKSGARKESGQGTCRGPFG